MSTTENVSPSSIVSLREVTAETVRAVCKLSDTLSEAQKRMVAPNAVSIAEAYFNEHAWFRAIYADDTLVGFIMLFIGPDEDNPEEMEYFLWRYMVAGPYQGMGFGRQALGIVIEDIKQKGARVFGTSCGEGEGSPEGFYKKLGFEPTGKKVGSEIVLEMRL
jgi:diamine N-acetyltransferase